MDLCIAGARVLDGTGAPWFRGHVGVADGRIAAVSRDDPPDADRTVDADGSVVCPGFVDAHTHSDLRLFAEPTLPAKTAQGVTTEILGQDGFSMAPVTDPGEFRETIAGMDGRSDRWDWTTVAEYLSSLADTGVAPNVATLVGHGTVRYEVLGMADRLPEPAELDRMAALVADALEEGAVGFSTGLVYTPQYNADTHEVQTLAAELAPHGRPFVAHIRSEGRWLWEAVDEFIDIGAEEEIPLHVSHIKLGGRTQQGKADRLLGTVEAARERGIDITADQYPYAAGSSPLASLLPPWVHSDGPEGVLERLRDGGARERIRADIEEWRIDGWENYGAQAGWENVTIASVGSGDPAVEGRTVADIAADTDRHPADVVCDILEREELEATSIERGMDMGDVRAIMAHPHVAVATDGLFGGKPHPRTYGTYPRVLGRFVREKNHLRLEEAVRKMTSLPARAMGLDRKGVLRPGMDADLVVFDPAVVAARATFENPRQRPVGIEHVLVGGEFVVEDGQHTGATPGSVIGHDDAGEDVTV